MEPPTEPPLPPGGPVHKHEQAQPANAAIDCPGRKNADKRFARACMRAVVYSLLGAAGIVAVLVITFPRGGGATTSKLEVKQAMDLRSGLDEMVKLHGSSEKFRQLGDLRGQKFYEAAFRANMLDPGLISKLVSKNSPTDMAASREWLDTPAPMPANSCSYTAPRADMLAEALSLKGKQRSVVFCFNSRNWNNYPDHGVLVFWSDGTKGQFMTFEDARDDWGITEEEWADPAGKLFGKKAPFQYTFE